MVTFGGIIDGIDQYRKIEYRQIMGQPINPLTDTQVKKANPFDKAYKFADGGGLYLHVSKNGNKSWRIDCTTNVRKHDESSLKAAGVQ